MSTIRLHPIIRYILSNLPPLMRRFCEDPIWPGGPREVGFEYYFRFKADGGRRVGGGISHCSQSSSHNSFALQANGPNIGAIKSNDFDVSLDDNSMSPSKETDSLKKGYPIGMGIVLFECSFYINYYSIEDQIPRSDYSGYDVNARNFPLIIDADFDFSIPELYGGENFARKYGRLNQLPIGSNSYAFILQKLGENFSEFRQKYDHMCQMTIDYLMDVGYTFNPNAHVEGTARLYHCDRELIHSLLKGERSGSIVWKGKTLDDGRAYICGLCQRPNGTKREILVRPVKVVRKDYHTTTPYMLQVKSEGLSRFFLPGSCLGRKLFSIFYRHSHANQTSVSVKDSTKYVNSFENKIKGIAFRTVSLSDFNESLLFENELLFINTLRKYTLLEVIKWRQAASESILGDGCENSHDFWVTRFKVGKKTFNIQLRRLFFTTVYEVGFTHFFTEIIVNNQARIFDVTSPAGMACVELHQTFLYLYLTEWNVRTPRAVLF